MDIIVIGAQKAGTTWLYRMLAQQPRVGFAFRKEVHYFDDLSNNKINLSRLKGKIDSRMNFFTRAIYRKHSKYFNYVTNPDTAYTDEWYRNIFTRKPSNEKLVNAGYQMVYADISPRYMMMPESGIRHMAKLLPGVTPLLIVRDPVKRMISGLNMLFDRNPERAEHNTKKCISMLRRMQVPRGDYRRAIEKYREITGGLHIVPFRRISTDPLGLLREIEGFYGLDQISYAGLSEKKYSFSGKFELSEEILDGIQELCAPQYEYLKNEFGAEFLKEI